MAAAPKKTIVLYNPRAVFFDMPLALLAIGTPLSEDYQVVIIDARIDPDPLGTLDRYTDTLLAVGVTSLTGAPLNDAIFFTESVRKRVPNVPIIWGGWHVSLFPEQVLEDVPEIDIAVQGQGEWVFEQLIRALDTRTDWTALPGISYRDNGVIRRTTAKPLQNMNALPRINYDLISVEAYFTAKGRRQFDYITSIGCFFRCTFCADPFVYNRKYSGFLPDRMSEDLLYYHERYGFDEVSFQDETFFTYKDRIVEFAHTMRRNGTPFTWTATMRADQGNRMTEEEFLICKQGGLKRLLIGVESGSAEMMEWLKKDIRPEQVLLCAERCRKLGIGAIFPFIVGFPGESDASITATKTMIRQLALMSPLFETPIFYFKPYPGTPITDEVVRKGEYTLPTSIREWAQFDYVGSRGPWVSEEKFRFFERYKFYLKLQRKQARWLRPLSLIARRRIRSFAFALPWEKTIITTLLPKKQLS